MLLAVFGEISEHADEGEYAGHAAADQVTVALMQPAHGVLRNIGKGNVAYQVRAAAAAATDQVLRDVETLFVDAEERMLAGAEAHKAHKCRPRGAGMTDHEVGAVLQIDAVQIRGCLAQDGRLFGRTSVPAHARVKGLQRVSPPFCPRRDVARVKCL